MSILKTAPKILAAAAVLVLVPGGSKAAPDDRSTSGFSARLDGAHETPSISTAATGSFQATLNNAGDELSFQLTYSGLEGGNTLFAHVHLGQTGVAGGVMFFLCGGGGRPQCPNLQATVTGTVRAADVIGPAGQGITAGQFSEVIKAMRSRLAYANVHTVTFPNGEIRGQVSDGENDDNQNNGNNRNGNNGNNGNGNGNSGKDR